MMGERIFSKFQYFLWLILIFILPLINILIILFAKSFENLYISVFLYFLTFIIIFIFYKQLLKLGIDWKKSQKVVFFYTLSVLFLSLDVTVNSINFAFGIPFIILYYEHLVDIPFVNTVSSANNPKIKNNSEKKKDNKSVKVLELIGFLTFVLFGIHQLVQPIFISQIKSLTITPLYLQSEIKESPDQFAEYYKHFKINYDILPTLISLSNTLTIKLPESVELFTPASGFWEKNPYVQLANYEIDKGIVESNKIPAITFNVTTNGFVVKEFPLTLFFREKISLECSDSSFSNDKLYTTPKSSPDDIPKIECYQLRKLGLGQIPSSRIIFSFEELIVRNRGNLDIRGFIVDIKSDNARLIRACENKRELNTIYREGTYQAYVSIDLKAGEERRLLILKQEPESFKEQDKVDIKTVYGYGIKFNFNSSHCDGDWNNFIG